MNNITHFMLRFNRKCVISNIFILIVTILILTIFEYWNYSNLLIRLYVYLRYIVCVNVNVNACAS